MTVPYFPLPSAVLLLAMPIPAWAWAIAQLPTVGFLFGYWLFDVTKIFPPAVLLWAAWPAIQQMQIRNKRVEP